MNMLLLGAILVTVTTNQLVAGVMLTCTLSADELTMTMRIAAEDDATHRRLVAVDATYGSNGCASTAITNNGVTQHVLEVDVSLDGAKMVLLQIDPVPGTTNCYVTTSGTVATFKILAESTVNFAQVGDIVYTPVECDSSTAASSTATSLISSITINTLTDTSITATPGGTVALSLVKDDFTPLVAPIVIGDATAILADYTRATPTFESPLFTHLFDLYVSNNVAFLDDPNSFNYVVKITDANGCPLNNAPFTIASTFVSRAADPALVLTTVPSTSSGTGKIGGANGLPVFTTSSTASTHPLYFRASFLTCDSVDNLCVNQETYCGNLKKRRRRSAAQGNLTEVLRVEVSMVGKGASLNLGGDGSGTNDEFVRECQEATKFWIAAIVMGILLLIVLVFAVFLFYKLQNQRRHNHKAESTYGVQNPSF